MTTNASSRPRTRSSTEEGASSVVISSAASASVVLQRELDRGVERCHQPIGERSGFGAGRLGGDRYVLANLVEVGLQLHDATMAPSWCQIKCHPPRRR